VFKSGERYRIDAQAYDTTSGTVMTAYKAEGPDLFPVVNDLTAGLLQRLSVTPQETAARSITQSATAYQAFLRGKDRYENLALEEARTEFDDALAADPGFVLARLYLAKSYIIDGDVEAALPMLEQALAHAEEIPANERMLAQALNTFYRNRDVETGTSLMAQLVEQFPRYGESYLWWGRALSDLDRKPLEAARKLSQALEMDPNDLLATAALAEQLARLGATEDARTMLLEARERNPEVGESIERLLGAY
jgi:tetratricopeptide (TPR) repeat protein